MAEVTINGRMKVKTLKKQFLDKFGLSLRIYDGKSFADEDSTIASIRKGGARGEDFSVKGNMKIGNIEKKFSNEFAIKSQVAGSDDSYLCKNELTLAAAKTADEKKMLKKAKIKTKSEHEANTIEDNVKKGEQTMGEQENIEFELKGAYDLNVEYQDFSIEDLKEEDLSELYELFVEGDEREAFYYHDEDFKNIKILANGSECQFTVNKNKLELDENEIRIISFYYYDETEYMPIEMTHPEGKDYNVLMEIEQLCDGVEYVDTITLKEGYNEESDNDEMFFELEYADPGDEDAAMVKIYICDNSGVIAKITDVDGESSEELFIQTIEKLIK